MSDYYDRQGQPITQAQWVARFAEDHRRIAEDEFVLDGVEIMVSTVWLGLDHQYGGGPPLIFETMIFGLGGEWQDWTARYSTELQAIEGHGLAVAALREMNLRALDEIWEKVRQ